MFNENQIHINARVAKELFKHADKNGSGTVTLDQFKALMNN